MVLENLHTTPLVTIGIPNFNYGHYVIESLESAVNQTYPNIEVIIVDDCSTDNSIEVIEEWIENYKNGFKIQFIKNIKNQGLTKVCNQILNGASGTFLQILDADDIFHKEKISRQISVLNADEKIALVYSNMLLIDKSGKLLEEDYFKKIKYDENKMPEGMIFLDLFNFNFIAYPLIRIKLAKVVGGFDETQQVHDYYLWLKLSEQYEIKYCPGKYSFYRIHEDSMSNSSRTNVKSLENVLTTKYRYFSGGNLCIQRIIKRDILNSITTLYENKYPTAGEWIKRNFIYNPSLKSFVYYFSYKLGIPYTFFKSIKKVFGGTELNDN